MWSLKSWCPLVLKILLFSRMVCYIFQVMWSEVEKTSHSRVWCHVCPLLVSWMPVFSWEAGWGCDVMPGLGALRRGWVRVSGLPSTRIRLPGCVGQRSNPVLCWQQLSSAGLHNQIAFSGYGQEVTYTLGKKGCYTPIEDNKTNVDRTLVFPLGWNWHDMDPWLFPKEIRHYLGQTFNARSSGIVELRNHSIGGRSHKSIFTLWQLWINICILFQKFFWLFNNSPSNPYGY